MNGSKAIKTTLGDLIAALAEETIPVVSDKRDGYRVVSYIVTDLFRKKRAAFTRRRERESEDGQKERRPFCEKRRAVAGGRT